MCLTLQQLICANSSLEQQGYAVNLTALLCLSIFDFSGSGQVK